MSANFPLSDEDVIRRKLLLNGEGYGDDQRLNALLKLFINWCQSDDDLPKDRSIYMFEKIIYQLNVCDLSMTKSTNSLRSMAKEMVNYEELSQKICKSMTNCKQKVIQCREELVAAKQMRENRRQYDSMAAVIGRHDNRETTMTRLKGLEEEIKALQRTRDELNAKLESRRQQFQVMLSASHLLQHFYNEDNEEEEESNGLMDDITDDEIDIDKQ